MYVCVCVTVCGGFVHGCVCGKCMCVHDYACVTLCVYVHVCVCTCVCVCVCGIL